jgi:hypothetical protein
MSVVTLSELTRHGRARRATVSFGGQRLLFENLAVWLDAPEGLAHLLDGAMERHLATVPLDSIFVEWEDLDPIQQVPHVAGGAEPLR